MALPNIPEYIRIKTPPLSITSLVDSCNGSRSSSRASTPKRSDMTSPWEMPVSISWLAPQTPDWSDMIEEATTALDDDFTSDIPGCAAQGVVDKDLTLDVLTNTGLLVRRFPPQQVFASYSIPRHLDMDPLQSWHTLQALGNQMNLDAFYLFNKHTSPLARRILIKLKDPINVDRFPFSVRYTLRTKQLLRALSVEARMVYILIHALANNLGKFNMASSSNAIEELLRHMVQYFEGLSAPNFDQIMRSLPRTFSKALERSLFCVAMEAGASRLTNLLLQRGFDPNDIVIMVHNHVYTALERSCINGSLEITQLLLRKGADPNRYLHKPLISCCFPSRTIQNSVVSPKPEIFAVLVKGGLEIRRETIARISGLRDSRLFSILIENTSNGDQQWLLETDFLVNALDIADNQTAVEIVSMVLETTRDMEGRHNTRFTSTLSTSLCMALRRNNDAAFRRLLDGGATPRADALVQAIETENLPMVRHLLDLGVCPYQHHPPESLAPIAEAIRANSAQILNVFWDRGLFTDLDGKHRPIEESIVAACEAGNELVLDTLLRLWEHCRRLIPPNYQPPSVPIRRSFCAAMNSGYRHFVGKLIGSDIIPETYSLELALWKRDFDLAYLFMETVWNLPDCGIALHLAVLSGCLEAVKSLVAGGVPLESLWNDHEASQQVVGWEKPWGIPGSYPILATAIFSENQTMINLLLDMGAPLETSEHRKASQEDRRLKLVVSPLLAAVIKGNMEIVRDFLGRGVSPCDGGAILHATFTGDILITRFLLDSIRPQHIKSGKGFGAQALCLAVDRKDLTALKMLAQHADANFMIFEDFGSNETRMTPFGKAVTSRCASSLQMMECLMENGAEVNDISEIRDWGFGSLLNVTPLLQAIATKNLEKAKMLVEAGAKIDAPAKLGIRRTPLQAAAEFGALDILNFLLEQGAQVNEPPAVRDGCTSLQIAADHGYTGIVPLLIERGADINAPAGLLLGRTAFEVAAERGRIEIMLLLAEHGVDLLANDSKQYQRALRFAKENGHLAVVDIVEKLYFDACSKAMGSILSLPDDEFQL